MDIQPAPRPVDWMGRGHCHDVDPETFFGPGGEIHRIAAAKRICAGCPVRNACLDYAIEEQMWGIWGGTTDAERKLLGRRRRQPHCNRGHELAFHGRARADGTVCCRTCEKARRLVREARKGLAS